MPAVNMTTTCSPQNMMWEVSVRQSYDASMEQAFEDPSNPAAEPNYPVLSLDDQIKAYEAMQAAQARQQMQYRRRRNEKPKVYFAEDALLYSSDRTVEEVKRMWYNRDELGEFKNERKQIVRVLKKANFDLVAVEQTGHYCLRGYEPYFSMEVNKAMKYARTLVCSLVMSEQDRQRAAGFLDDETMRLSCYDASQWARENALQLGRNDEFDVYGDYEECYNMIMEDTSNHGCYNELDFYDTTINNDNNNNFEVSAASYSADDTILQQSILGKRKDMEQPESPSRPRTPENESSNDNLAERLDCALKLVEALRFGTRSTLPS